LALVNMQELYNSPDARVFAVGYAARQISCGAQLQRLFSNPPLAHGLQLPAARWNVHLASAMLPCATCGRLTATRTGDMKDAVSRQPLGQSDCLILFV
jgi:hypothetical protein